MPRRRQRILAIILAGGKGERLMPLTTYRSKPAVPFAGKYRIIDFVLSNFVNSGILTLFVLVQYRSQSLIEHLRRAWRIGAVEQHFITVVPPQMKSRGTWYLGTADAVHQNLNLIRDFAPDVVAVFGADHIYRMDIQQMIQFHAEREADATVAALPVPLRAARGFGIIEADPESRIVGFEEKPKRPKAMPLDPDRAYASMGNYLFNTDTLYEALKEDAHRSSAHDFGRDILPRLIGTRRMLAYDFLENEVPAVKPYEERGYWRDVGTVEAYWQAHMDLLGERPNFDLRNRSWPICSDHYNGPPASLVRSRLDEAMVGQESHVTEADLRRSVIGRNVRIEPGVVLDECVVLDDVAIGAKSRLRRVIVDRAHTVSPRTEIGFDRTRPRDASRPKIVVLQDRAEPESRTRAASGGG